MARTILKFNLISEATAKVLSLEFRPEEQGYSIWINNIRRYQGQTFTTSEVKDRLYHIARGYEITTDENPKWLVRDVTAYETGVKASGKGKRIMSDNGEAKI